MLEFEFMRRALIVGFLLSLIIPSIGVIVVLKKTSMIGDALSHVSLFGVGVGLLLGFNPIIGALVMSILATLSIEAIRKVLGRYEEMAVAIVMSMGIGLAGIVSSFTGNNLNSFLFGSIVAISDFEYYSVFVIAFIVLATFILLYRELMYISFDEKSATLSKVKVKTVNFIFTILTALTISIASRTVGALMVSSLMIIPVAISLLMAKSYLQTILYSIGFSIFFTLTGLTVSYYLELKPGSSIVVIGITTLLSYIIIRFIVKKFKFK